MSVPKTSPGEALAPPRFDLRLSRGRCALVLRRPVEVGAIVVRALELDAPVAGSVDVARGAAALLTRRLRVVALEALVPASRFGAWVPGLELVPVGERVEVAVSDAVGALATRLQPLPAGRDLLLFVEDLRFVVEGPFSPWRRLRDAFRAAELPWDGRVGAFRVERPVRRLLAELFLPRGWRLPASPPGIALSFGREGALLRAGDAEPHAALDAALAAAAPLPSMLEGLPTEAPRPTWVERCLDGRSGGLAGALAAALEGDGPPRRWLRAHAAFRAAEPTAGLRADAALATAERLLRAEAAGSHVPVDGAVLTDLVLSGLGASRDTKAWRRWVERLAAVGRPEALAVARAGLANGAPAAERASVAALAIDGVLARLEEDEGDDESPPDLDALLADAETLATAARTTAPELPEVLAAGAWV
ncbi:MAG: hypothetical protein AAGH15_10925, partial [Myxococcota bacterium]